MSTSARGVGGSHSNVATPPNKKSVIARVRTPNRRATSACANSCAITLAKSNSAHNAARAIAAPCGTPLMLFAIETVMNA
jgi:hypothetical protein